MKEPEKDRTDYRGRTYWEMPAEYRGAAGQMRYAEDCLEAEPQTPQLVALLAAQQRGEVALCAAFREHPTRSRDARHYPRYVDSMAGYIATKMTDDIREREGREPLDVGNVKRIARILARIWATGVLQAARL